MIEEKSANGEKMLSWPDIAQTLSATVVAFFSVLLVLAVLARVKPIRDRLAARKTEIERRLAEMERDRGSVRAEGVKGGEE
jgi:F0F1-type ATP synthase membrane subunit b/b'